MTYTTRSSSTRSPTRSLTRTRTQTGMQTRWLEIPVKNPESEDLRKPEYKESKTAFV